MLIDEEFLYLEDEEADKIYAQLKARQFRRKNMEETEMRLNLRMSQLEEMAKNDSNQAVDINDSERMLAS